MTTRPASHVQPLAPRPSDWVRWPLSLLLLVAAASVALPSYAQTPSADAAQQPRAIDVRPKADSTLPDRAAFALRLAEPLKAAPRAACDVSGVRSSIPVEVVEGEQRVQALRALGIDAADADAAASAPKPWVVLRCKTSFPDGAYVTLRWLDPKPAVDPRAEPTWWNGQPFGWVARSDWPLSIHCTRSNAEGGCNPLEPLSIRFTRSVRFEHAIETRLEDAAGKTYAPDHELMRAYGNGAFIDALHFKGLPPDTTLTIRFPPTLGHRGAPYDDLLVATRSKPARTVRIAGYPALVKFASTFGIVERGAGGARGVVPLTVRGVAPDSSAAAALKLRHVRIASDANVIEALNTLQRVVGSDDLRANRFSAFDYEYDPGMDPSEPTPTPPPEDKTKRKPNYPFKPFEDAAKNTTQDPGAPRAPQETRNVSWLAPLKTAQTQDLGKQLGGHPFEVLGVPLEKPGFYLLEAESLRLGRELLGADQAMYVRSGALVTDLAVHLHRSEGTSMVWVTRLSSGKPVAGADVTLYTCEAARLGRAGTDAQGVATIDTRDAKRARGDCPLYAIARQGDDFSLVRSDWQNGIESWRFQGLPYEYEYTYEAGGASSFSSRSRRVTHAVLARNLLRAGETLHAKLYWRALDTKGALVAPDRKDLPANVDIVHVGSGERTLVRLEWDERGNAVIAHPLPEGAKRGAYSLQLAASATVFRVEDFKLPALKAEVTSPVGIQLSGQPVAATLRLSYLSGGPAAGEKVKVTQRLVPHVPTFADHEAYFFGADPRMRWQSGDDAYALSPVDQSVEQDVLAGNEDQELELDAQGSATVTAKPSKALRFSRTLITDMEYRDPNGETYRAQGRTVVWPTNMALGVKTPGWWEGSTVAADHTGNSTKPLKVEFVVLDPSGKPRPNIAVTLQGGFDGWITHRRKTVGGFYAYQHEQYHGTKKPLCSGKSDRQGKLACEFTPDFAAEDGKQIESGSMSLVATAADGAGRETTTVASMWVYGGGQVWFEPADHDRMDVLSDKPAYAAGEVASFQVRSPFRDATALVSVLRAGGVVDTLVVALHGANPTVKLPIKPEYAPNVFVNVLAVRGRVAEPAPTALVDLARPAFKLGVVGIDVKSAHHDLTVKVSSDKPVYQSREVAQLDIRVTPHASMPLKGDQQAAVFVLDEALLELMPNPTWQVVQAMLGQRGYGFETSSAAMQVVGKRHYGRKALPAGGGGGKSAARELFDTLLVWQGKVALDAEGRARVPVTVNDSLTRFRIVVIADAGAAQFGVGEASFTATKDLQVRSGLPAMLREGDRFSAVFTLRNSTHSAMTVAVRAAYTATLGATPGQPVDAKDTKDATRDVKLPERKLALKPGEAKTLEWPVDVPADAQQIAWRIDAQAVGTKGAAASDSLRITQPVATPLTPLRFGVGDESIDAAAPPLVWPLKAPAGSAPGRGELRVTLSPALALDASGVREYMKHYPFFCLEQRTSKAVSLKDGKLWSVIAGTIGQYLHASGLVNYYPNQGGYDQGYDVLTSFVLSASHEAGFELPEGARERMLAGLTNFVQGRLERRFQYHADDAYDLTHRKLLALEAIARHRQVPPELADSLKLAPEDLAKLSNRSIVQWLDVLQRSTHWPNVERLRALSLAEFDRRIVATGQGALTLSRERMANHWYYMDSEATTQVRAALLALSVPELAAKAEGLARGALALQRAGTWYETQANVWGSLMFDRRAERATGGIGGITSIAVGTKTIVHDWTKQPKGATYTLPLPAAAVRGASATGRAEALAPERASAQVRPMIAVAVLHKGGGRPHASAHGTAWGMPARSVESLAAVSRSVKPLRQQRDSVWSVGDVVEVTVKFRADAPSGWFVVTDPIPPGSTVLGSGLRGQDALPVEGQRGWRNADGSYEGWPSYVERSFGFVRAYYETVWGDTTLTYQLRINTPGVFRLPATQFEAMYDPSIHASTLPLPLEVKAVEVKALDKEMEKKP